MDKIKEIAKEGVIIIEKNVGEIHLILKDKHGKLKENRLTTDKRREKCLTE